MWVSIAVSCAQQYDDAWQHLGWLSPMFTVFLLIFVSGVPLLEKEGLRRYGKDEEYIKYLKNTPLIIPKLF